MSLWGVSLGLCRSLIAWCVGGVDGHPLERNSARILDPVAGSGDGRLELAEPVSSPAPHTDCNTPSGRSLSSGEAAGRGSGGGATKTRGPVSDGTAVYVRGDMTQFTPSGPAPHHGRGYGIANRVRAR